MKGYGYGVQQYFSYIVVAVKVIPETRREYYILLFSLCPFVRTSCIFREMTLSLKLMIDMKIYRDYIGNKDQEDKRFEPHSGEVYSIQLHVINFVSDLR
jgi:hypothetical protein